MKIAVLAGGSSEERAISIVSGTEVANALKSKGHDVFLIDMFYGCTDEEARVAFEKSFDVASASKRMSDKTESLRKDLQLRRELIGPNVLALCQKADKVFLALHGAGGEDGKIQALFDLYGISYSGTGYLSSAIAMDKELTKQFFSWNGVNTPKGAAVHKDNRDKSYSYLGLELPVVVKPCCGGSSVGVAIARSDEEYALALKDAFSYEDRVVVEEYIEGREFSVAVVGDIAYPVIEIAPIEGFYDYKNKYSEGLTVETCPAQITREKAEEMQSMALRGANALMISGYCRLDFMMDGDGTLYCLEANTLPGMTPTSLIPREAAVLGIDFPMLCEKLLGI